MAATTITNGSDLRIPVSNFIQCKSVQSESGKNMINAEITSPFIQKKESGDGMVATDAVSSRISQQKGSGSQMEGSTRSFMENRFGTDFSNVKIHTGNEAVQLSRDLGAKAFTVGSDIYFNNGEYRPEAKEGKHLLAHELTHTIQQKHSMQVQRLPAKGPNFVFGDIVLNPRAASDVVSKNVLLDDTDQKHLSVQNGKLGYDANYTDPEDPFRWNKIVELIRDNTPIDINGVGMADAISFNDYQVSSGNLIPDTKSLSALNATGITLPVLSMELATFNALAAADKAANNGKQAPVPKTKLLQVSSNQSRSMVYYESGRTGRSVMGRNSLAHELLGHLWLVKNGKPYAHGEKVGGVEQLSYDSEQHVRDNVEDPLGGISKGAASTYIEKNIDSNEYLFKSPSWRVGLKFVSESSAWLKTSGAAELKTIAKTNKRTNTFYRHWYTFNNNYAVGIQTTGNTSVADLVKKNILDFYCSLGNDDQSTFRGALIPMKNSGGLGGKGQDPSLLATVILNEITTNSPCQAAPAVLPALPANPPAQQAFESRPVDMQGNPVDTLK